MTGLTIAAAGVRKGGKDRAGQIGPRMTRLALRALVGAAEVVARPESMIEPLCSDEVKTFGVVASCAVGIPVHELWKMKLVESALVHILVACAASCRSPMKRSRRRTSLVTGEFPRLLGMLMTKVAGDRGVRPGESEIGLCMLFQCKDRPLKRLFAVTGVAVAPPEMPMFKLTVVRIAMTFLA